MIKAITLVAIATQFLVSCGTSLGAITSLENTSKTSTTESPKVVVQSEVPEKIQGIATKPMEEKNPAETTAIVDEVSIDIQPTANDALASEKTIAAAQKEVKKEAEKKIIEKATIAKTLAAKKPIVKKTGVDHQPWNTLLRKHVSTDGVVNYKGFIKDKVTFNAYLKVLSKTVPQAEWTTNSKLAYWLNAYNAFTVKLIIDNYPTKSIKDIKNPWDQRFFQIGEKWYNLNEIEHKILRKMNDPRIHFGINCASFSCPPILNKAFTPSNVDATLEQLAIAFVNDPSRNDISENNITISKIFQWFAKDFKTDGDIIDFLNKYAKVTIAKNAKKNFMDYNWSLNE